MKKTLLILSFCFCFQQIFAKHIIGGEMFYTYIGKGQAPNTSKYQITLRLFRDDYAPADAAEMPADVYIGIFNNDNNTQFPNPQTGSYFQVSRSSYQSVNVNSFPSCMVKVPKLAYHSADFTFTVELPNNSKGYTASYQTCCRITPIDNTSGGSRGEGSTFSCLIPPKPDNSPVFDATIDAVCGGKQFDLQFSAKDLDGDSLSYAFEGAYNGGSANDAKNFNPSPPPYSFINYRGNYSALEPLGPKASIDPRTGTISGIAPPTGRYVVTVAVTSWRKNGNTFEKLSVHRKDFIINVSDCDFASAELFPRASHCDDFLVTFQNDDYSPYNKTFYWEFYDSKSNLITTSTDEAPKIQFSDTGRYRYKLIVNKGDQCSDTADQTIGVYPGFFPSFNYDGKCINSEVFFADNSTAKYGTINYWKWDFGDGKVLSDTSNVKNPKYIYNKVGDYTASLIVKSNLGCLDTTSMSITMIDKPQFSVSNDTLICSLDDLLLSASGTGKGTVTWTPNYQINNVNSFNPIVSPKKTTTYFANYEESRGCNNMDSVVVRVVDYVTLNMPADTTICLTDSVALAPVSDGLQFQWTPASTLLDSKSKNTIAIPTSNTNYQLTATIGKCNTTRNVRVNTVPYPPAQATPDTALCVGNSVQLNGTGGAVYEWQPNIFLNNNQIANPVASPTRSVQYILKVKDFIGCPKPSYDTLLLKVITPYIDAGPRDTAIVVGEPLQLNAKANGENFLWNPSTGLSNPYISNPVAILNSDQEFRVSVVTEGNCIAMDTIMVKVYNLKPGFYVPNAFTPNGDGLNDILRPIAFGLKNLKYFRIYNRLGQLVFNTNSFKEGWDGTIRGVAQDPSVFVWTAEAFDYTGKRIQAKGNVTLIR